MTERCDVCQNLAPTHDRYCPRQPGAFPYPRQVAPSYDADRKLKAVNS